MKVFLGGTCAESKWREIIIPQLKCDYFNPVVDDWTPDCQKVEEEEKKICGYHLYVITPKMKGVFSIAEAVNDSLKLPEGCCVFCVTKEEDDRDFTDGEMRSLEATAKIIKDNGGRVFYDLNDVVEYLNSNSYESLKKETEYWKKWSDFQTKLWNNLMKQILPDGWYCESMDCWEGTKEEYISCVERLNRPFVQKIIKRD